VSLITRIQEAACCHKTVDQLVRNAEALETWSGLHVCLCPNVGEGMTLLRKHFQCKSHKPQETSALVVLPQEEHAMCCPLLTNMTCFGQHQLTYTDPKQWICQDIPCADPGVLASTQLPEAVQLLHAQSSDKEAALTFIF
jgi:hypothetical protein